MIEDIEIAIVSAASKALELLNKDPYVSFEEIIQNVMRSIDANSDIKIKAIAAVNDIVKMRRQFKNLSDKQIIQNYIESLPKGNESEENTEN